MYIDTHAHLYGEEFLGDVDAVVLRARQAGAAKIVIPAVDEASAAEAAELGRKYPHVLYPMVGLHPEDLPSDYKDVLLRMEGMLKREHHPFVGIGEVGLDFYWDDTRKEEQTDAFRIQIEWALNHHLPLMIHSRAAHKELIGCLNPYKKEEALRGVFHCFSGTVEEAGELLTEFPRFVLGIGGILTFKKSALPSVLEAGVPLERIVLETDSPYMAPVPHRGKRNEPSFLPEVTGRLSQIYHVPVSEVERITTENALRAIPLLEC